MNVQKMPLLGHTYNSVQLLKQYHNPTGICMVDVNTPSGKLVLLGKKKDLSLGRATCGLFFPTCSCIFLS